MINNVTLVGRLVAPPDLRKTPNNVSSLQGTLAVNRNFKNENGDREADFINFQAWRGTADMLNWIETGNLNYLTLQQIEPRENIITINPKNFAKIEFYEEEEK